MRSYGVLQAAQNTHSPYFELKERAYESQGVWDPWLASTDAQRVQAFGRLKDMSDAAASAHRTRSRPMVGRCQLNICPSSVYAVGAWSDTRDCTG